MNKTYQKANITKITILRQIKKQLKTAVRLNEISIASIVMIAHIFNQIFIAPKFSFS